MQMSMKSTVTVHTTIPRMDAVVMLTVRLVRRVYSVRTTASIIARTSAPLCHVVCLKERIPDEEWVMEDREGDDGGAHIDSQFCVRVDCSTRSQKTTWASPCAQSSNRANSLTLFLYSFMMQPPLTGPSTKRLPSLLHTSLLVV